MHLINIFAGGEPSPVLQEVLITIFDSSTCERGYSTLRDFSRVWPKGMPNNLLTCAGDLAGGKDSCQVKILSFKAFLVKDTDFDDK